MGLCLFLWVNGMGLVDGLGRVWMRAAIINPVPRNTKECGGVVWVAAGHCRCIGLYFHVLNLIIPMHYRGITMSELETGRNRRRHMRTKLRARIKLRHPSVGEVVVHTGDISDGGVFIHAGDAELPPVGSEVKVQVQDLPVDAPELDARIVRMEHDGIGLEFILP